MRRPRSRLRSQRRKSRWESADFWSGIGGHNENQIITFWTKWPAGTVDVSGTLVTFDYITEENQTLVKTFVQAHFDCEPPGLTGDEFQISMALGLIAWESANPENFDLGVFDTNPFDFTIENPPNPHDGGFDWVYNQRWQGSGRGSLFPTLPGVQNDIQQVSKAQRKLPAGVGILACLGFIVLPTLAEVNDFRWWVSARHLFKDP